MKILKGGCLILLAFFALRTPTAKEVGKISYLEGEASISRDGEILEDEAVDFGTIIENFDIISTSPRSTLSITLNYDKKINSEIIVNPGTVFSVEIEQIDNTRKADVNMFSGGIALKVSKMLTGDQFNVRTETANLGVRGTSFFVEASPAGDLLVSCGEGQVECSAPGTPSVYAQPGTVVEKSAGENWRAVPVAVSDLESFRSNWMAEKMAVFKANPLRAMRQYARLYREKIAGFNAAYSSLMEHREIIEKWSREEKTDKRSGTGELLRDKKAIIGALLQMRGRLVIFEKVYFRLVELEGYYKQGYGQGEIEPGVSVSAFFAGFETDKKELRRKMAYYRYALKLYTLRNDGTFPADGLGGGEDNFFRDNSRFFGDSGL